jgi:hypothetical protein
MVFEYLYIGILAALQAAPIITWNILERMSKIHFYARIT